MLISHDRAEALKGFADARNIGYTMLSDAKAEIIPAFGIANPQFKKSSPWYGIALPIIFVVDKDGVIRHRFSTRNYTNRPDVDTIFHILKGEVKG